MERHPGLGPGEEVNEGPVPVTPRTAASVIVVRGGDSGLELLLVQRTHAARFMAGVWVFPGGSVDAADGDLDDPVGLQYALRVAAQREVAEEAGIQLSGDALVPFSRWITPAHLMTRFDTWFFVGTAPRGAQARIDGQECIDFRWTTPAAALAAHAAGELSLVFPTIKHLEALRAFGSANELLQYAHSIEIEPVEPRMAQTPDGLHVLLPGDPGYDSAGRA
jgi:8-oxo-dGTP pyrophosphatase MutT (NUDIX family)